MADDFSLHPEPARLLTGRRAVVTGATTGIGRGIAFELAAHGAAVAINHRGTKADIANEMTAAIERAGGRAMPAQFDVTKEEEVGRAFAGVRDAFGGIDLLVNNAGIENRAPLWELELDDWRAVLDVNLTGAFLCAREAARGMLDAKEPGAIVNISSVHEQIPWRGYSHYCASKGGMRLWSQSIAYELAPHGVRVLNIAPGAIATPINRAVLEDPEQRAQVEGQIPLGRWGDVDDVARAVAWVASEKASYVVGATLFVDGGMTLYPNFV